MTRAIPILLLAGCATHDLPPFPPTFDRAIVRTVAAQRELTGPPEPGLLIEWRASSNCVACPHFAEIMDTADPNAWHRFADGLIADSNGVIQTRTPGPGNFRCGVRY